MSETATQAPTDGTTGRTLTAIGIAAVQERHDRKMARIAIAVAAALHVVIFAITWPTFASSESGTTTKESKIYVVRQVKFTPPPPRPEQMIARKQTKKMPIPDPTPDEPEPIRSTNPADELDFIPDDNLAMGIPEAPPPIALDGPLRFVQGGRITEPVKISGPNPSYPEAARRARIQGMVLLECVIGKDGSVKDLKVLRGLPLGLTEAAVEAVRQWEFKPSTLNGLPVEVVYIQMVRFHLANQPPG